MVADPHGLNRHTNEHEADINRTLINTCGMSYRAQIKACILDQAGHFGYSVRFLKWERNFLMEISKGGVRCQRC